MKSPESIFDTSSVNLIVVAVDYRNEVATAVRQAAGVTRPQNAAVVGDFVTVAE